MSNIENATKELHVAFKELNRTFFNDELVEPAITIQTSGKRLAMGWCSAVEVWWDKEGIKKRYELNISAEYLNVDFMETMDTMMHEMVHLYNGLHGIQDTSRNGTYHNKRFKHECERRGFEFDQEGPDKRYGWAYPKLTERAKKIISMLNIRTDAFVIARKRAAEISEEESEDSQTGRSRKKSFKWFCPSCGDTVRSTKEEVYLKCGKCDKDFEMEE